MQQRQTSYVSQSYTEVASFQDNNSEQLNKKLKPILDFVEQFKLLTEAADKLFKSEEQENNGQFDQILQSVFKAEFGGNSDMFKQFKHFIEKFA